MNAQMENVRKIVVQYDIGKDMLLLRKAGEQLEQVDLFAGKSPAQRGEERLHLLSGWLAVITRIDAARNPKFAPDDPPATRVSPRNVPGQPAYPPGVDPGQISDPQVRAEYEQAIAENKQKADRSQQHWDLQAIDMEVTQGIERFLKKFYTSSPADQHELIAAMTQAKIAPGRQKQLLGFAAK